MGNRISLLIAVSLLACSPAEPRVPEPTLLPSVPVATLEGQTTDLRSVIAGRVSLVNLWASWCEACQAEQRALNQLSARVNPNQAVVVGVAVGEARQQVLDFLQLHPANYAQFVDESFKFADAIQRNRVPTTIVVQRSGRIVFEGGAVDAHSLQAFRDAMSETTTGVAASH
jgi:thiol-disulfide isomerase/thioredoxin